MMSGLKNLVKAKEPMKTMILKELKTILKPGIFTFLGLLGGIILLVRDEGFYGVIRTDGPLLLIPATIVGFFVGFFQFQQEHGRDQWAFYVHRPLSIYQLFAAKSLAALFYSLCFYTPFVVGFVFLLQQESLGYPINPYYLNKLFYLWLLGIPVYWIGVYISLNLNWASWSLIVLVVPITSTFPSITDQVKLLFYYITIVTLTLILLAMVFSKVTMIHRFEKRNWTKIPEVLCSTVVAFAFTMFGISFIWEYLRASKIDQRYHINDNGEIFSVSSQQKMLIAMKPFYAKDKHTESFKKTLTINNFFELEEEEIQILSSMNLIMSEEISRNNRRHNETYENIDPKHNIRWFYSTYDQLLKGFHIGASQVVAGYIGPAGFTNQVVPETERFTEQPYFFRDYLIFGSKLMKVDFQERSLSTIRHFDKNNPFLTLLETENDESYNRAKYQILQFQKTIEIYEDPKIGYEVLLEQAPEITIPLDTQKNYRVMISRLPNQRGHLIQLEYNETYSFIRGAGLFRTIQYYDNQGQFLHSLNFPRAPSMVFTPDSDKVSIGVWFLFDGLAYLYDPDAYQQSRTFDLPMFLVILLLSLGSGFGVFIYLKNKTQSLGELFAWTVYSGLMGPLGVFSVWIVFTKPSQVVCPTCGKKDRLTKENCRHCQASLLEAPSDGTEIIVTG